MSLRLTHSLRRRLLWSLFAAISLAAGVQAIVAYRTALGEVDIIFDQQMQEMARSLRPGMPIGGVPDIDSKLDDDDERFDFFVQIWTTAGLPVFQSPARTELPHRTAPGFSTVLVSDTSYRVFSVATGSQIIQVAQDLEARRRMASTLALRTVGPMAVMVPLLMLVIWWVISVSLAPLARVRQEVSARQESDLSEVSEAGLPDEIRPLVRELNLLLQRMRQAFDLQQNFVADAAHELRSPLAALKLQVQGVRRAVTEVDREVAAARLTAGIDRATRLVEQLLVLARQQSGTPSAAIRTPTDLSSLARSVLMDAYAAACARKIDLGLEHADYALVLGQEEALHILVRNLLDNAIKYTPTGGQIDLGVYCSDGRIVLSVEDTGPGIPVADRERVLDRFYRVAGTEATGSGLGLSIVRAVADLHGAHLTIGSSPNLGGLRITVSFPGEP